MPKANDRIGPYQLIRKLGEGGFGEAWLARDFDSSTPREVAVKMPLKSEIDLDALLQEATAWARATGHPNVLEFLAARVFDGQVALVSEYAPDGSLKDWLGQHGGRAPSVEAAVKMTRGILAGLEHLHGRSIIHRDVKPENVLLSGTTPRLADFGISRILKSTSKSAVSAGTPLYMAPEAFNRKRNQQTDLWSVGVILYQMLSGRLPFDGNDIAELYGAILNEVPEPLPALVPEWLRQAVAKSLTKEPERRFRTAAEMSATLAPPAPRIEEKPALQQRRTAPVEEPPPKREPNLVEPQPPKRNPIIAEAPRPNPVPTAPRTHRLSKWLTGLLAGVLAIALTIYLATNSATPPSDAIGSAASDEQSFTEDLNGVKLETHLVGQKQANAFGLYDMHGNVWEWCEDVWHDSYGGRHGAPPTDGSAWLNGGDPRFRPLRGGSWRLYSGDLRSSFRIRVASGDRSSVTGLRVVVSARAQ